jgi:hypothetical protein
MEQRVPVVKTRRLGREILIQIGIALATLVVIEVVLRILQPTYLMPERAGVSGYGYRYDAEIGWSPIPDVKSPDVQNNSLGLRDSEPDGSRPTVLFLGDSLVWGVGAGVTTADRFTELLKPQFPSYRILNAGVAGYGTDQEYLMLTRLWDKVKPAVVVLTFCTLNDRNDNSHNVRYNYYKPYIEQTSPNVWQFRGQPAPPPKRDYMAESWFARNSMLGRVAMSVYIELRHRRVTVPDPTEHLVGMIRDFVQSHGAKLLVGIQDRDAQLETYLTSQNIPFVNFVGDDIYDPTRHWTVKGQVFVADHYAKLLSEHGVARNAASAPANPAP